MQPNEQCLGLGRYTHGIEKQHATSSDAGWRLSYGHPAISKNTGKKNATPRRVGVRS